MSKTLLAVALLAIIGLSACKKDEEDPTIPSTFVQKGSITYQNNSGDLYDIYLDDARYGNLYGGKTSIYPSVPVGAHRVKAIQKANIVGTATLREQIVIVAKDTTVVFAFP